MKNHYTLIALALFTLLFKSGAQTFNPISTFGYNIDAVAENTTALATTGGAIDGSNFVLYSAAYAVIYSSTGGLPNNGLVATGTRTYQLQSYTANNILYVPTGVTDSISFTSPSPYSGISLLCFSTEGNAVVTITLRFTDNSTQVFTGQNLVDWFGSGSTVISGFDRCGRNTGTPANVGSAGNPKMYSLDLSLTCVNRLKNLQRVIIQNTGTNPRACIMAVSGAAMPSFTAGGLPVTCAGGSNGGATVTAAGGMPPYSYTFATTPPQTGTSASNLSVGIYSYTATDAATCAVSGTFAVTQSLAPQPPVSISTNYNAVCAGSPVTMACSGANTYTWISYNSNATIMSFTPATTTTYSVAAITLANCFITGSMSIVVNPIPVILFSLPSSLCINAANIALTASPIGGLYQGQGMVAGFFNPVSAGVGTKTISYTYTDPNNCSAALIKTVVVNALPVVTFTINPNQLCLNAAALTLTANPNGGVYAGTGISGSVFNPSLAGAGTFSASYSYTDANGCSATKNSSITVNALPSVSISSTKKFFCTNAPSLFLNANPSGGIYTGPGITNSSFSPSLAGVGTPTITYAYTDGNNCSASAALVLTVSACTGIEQNNASNALLTIYPNPNHGYFTIKGTQFTSVNVINELGQAIKHLQLNETNDFQLHISDLAEGLYFIMGQSENGSITAKILVQH